MQKKLQIVKIVKQKNNKKKIKKRTEKKSYFRILLDSLDLLELNPRFQFVNSSNCFNLQIH